jgi:hypothetical protein
MQWDERERGEEKEDVDSRSPPPGEEEEEEEEDGASTISEELEAEVRRILRSKHHGARAGAMGARERERGKKEGKKSAATQRAQQRRVDAPPHRSPTRAGTATGPAHREDGGKREKGRADKVGGSGRDARRAERRPVVLEGESDDDWLAWDVKKGVVEAVVDSSDDDSWLGDVKVASLRRAEGEPLADLLGLGDEDDVWGEILAEIADLGRVKPRAPVQKEAAVVRAQASAHRRSALEARRHLETTTTAPPPPLATSTSTRGSTLVPGPRAAVAPTSTVTATASTAPRFPQHARRALAEPNGAPNSAVNAPPQQPQQLNIRRPPLRTAPSHMASRMTAATASVVSTAAAPHPRRAPTTTTTTASSAAASTPASLRTPGEPMMMTEQRRTAAPAGGHLADSATSPSGEHTLPATTPHSQSFHTSNPALEECATPKSTSTTSDVGREGEDLWLGAAGDRETLGASARSEPAARRALLDEDIDEPIIPVPGRQGPAVAAQDSDIFDVDDL